MKCPVYEKSCIENVLSMKCPVLKCSLNKEICEKNKVLGFFRHLLCLYPTVFQLYIYYVCIQLYSNSIFTMSVSNCIPTLYLLCLYLTVFQLYIYYVCIQLYSNSIFTVSVSKSIPTLY